MNNFEVYYELNGRKMKTAVRANNQAEAVEKIKQRLIIHQVNPVLKNTFEEIFDKIKCATNVR